MITIWKYEIINGQPAIMQMKKGAQILSVQVQDNKPVIWALVDTEAPDVGRAIYVALTGNKIDVRSTRFEFIGTCQLDYGIYVVHFFDCGEVP